VSSYHLGRIPEEGESIDFDIFAIKVDKVKGTRILNVTVYPKNLNEFKVN
jgi:CBS domain containing-hemolysin-like protein